MDPKTGLYSKAAEIIRNLPQAKGSVDQMIGAARKLGLKDVELSHAGDLPTGPISRDDLAAIFDARKPRLRIDQYGENPPYLSREEQKERRDLQTRNYPLTPEEEARSKQLSNRLFAGPNVLTRTDDDDNEEPQDPEYSSYASDGTQYYRERLLKLEGNKNHPVLQAEMKRDQVLDWLNRHRDRLDRDIDNHGADHAITAQTRDRIAQLEQDLQGKQADVDRARMIHGDPKDRQPYQSSHWSDHPDVLAHIRLSDRQVGEDREAIRPIMERLAQMAGVGIRDLSSGAVHVGVAQGVITPEEAASVSRIMRWYTPFAEQKGIGKRLLHVEELQSDWAQQGRDQGFNTGEARQAYRAYIKDLQGRYQQRLTDSGMEPEMVNQVMDNTRLAEMANKMGELGRLQELQRGDTEEFGKVPKGPYVQNTQHWTDLALKNVLREAALGNYDGIVFPSGQNQADRYGLEKHLDRLQYMPNQKTLVGFKNGAQVVYKEGIEQGDLHGLIGKDLTERLLHPDNTFNPTADNQFHDLRGDDLKLGGQGMKGYYDGIVPKSALRLARMHDPDIQPAEPITYNEGGEPYQGFHLPVTDKLKQGILDKGYPAFRRGGRIGKANGGSINEDAGASAAAPAAQGAVPVGGGVRGGAGLLQAPDEAPLEGLPQSVRIPRTGEVIQAGPDPRIRGVARSYMQQAGLPYNPPTKYAKVDPARAKRIAAAYEAMPHDPSDPLTRASYAAMIKETLAQYEAAKAAGFKAEFWNPEKQRDPYEASPRLAVEDVRRNHHMWVYPTLDGYGSGAPSDEEEARRNPMLQLTGETWNGIPVTVNDIFRAVHDYFGHAKEGVGFRHDGEENAWRAHASMFSPLARLAMTTETRGQNSWLNFGPHGEKNQTARTEDTEFAPQKMGILPHWVHHEGAEDFMGAEEIAKMAHARAKHGVDLEKALGMTRSFTKDGRSATMRLKI